MQKYEKEIEELIERLQQQDDQAPRPIRRDQPPQLPRHKPPVRRPMVRWPNPSLSPAYYMTSGLALVVLSWIVPISGIRQWLAILGVLLFLWPIVANVFTRGAHTTGRPEKAWRGRSIESDDRSWGDIRRQMDGAARDFRRRFRRRF